MCVCSDGCAYGVNQDQGNLSMNVDDIISFKFNSISGKFTVRGPANRYSYSVSGLENKEYVLFLGFASGSTNKLTVRGV